MRDWCDVLEHLPQELIQKAVVQHLACTKGHKPTPGEIRGIAQSLIPTPRLVARLPMPQVERRRVTAEEASQIMAERGFKPKKFGGFDATE